MVLPANIILEYFMYRMNVLLGLILAGFMGTATAVGPGYLGDLDGQNVSINNTISGLGTPITDVYSVDIGSTTSETIATAVKVKLQYGSSSTPSISKSRMFMRAGGACGGGPARLPPLKGSSRGWRAAPGCGRTNRRFPRSPAGRPDL